MTGGNRKPECRREEYDDPNGIRCVGDCQTCVAGGAESPPSLRTPLKFMDKMEATDIEIADAISGVNRYIGCGFVSEDNCIVLVLPFNNKKDARNSLLKELRERT